MEFGGDVIAESAEQNPDHEADIKIEERTDESRQVARSPKRPRITHDDESLAATVPVRQFGRQTSLNCLQRIVEGSSGNGKRQCHVRVEEMPGAEQQPQSEANAGLNFGGWLPIPAHEMIPVNQHGQNGPRSAIAEFNLSSQVKNGPTTDFHTVPRVLAK